MDHLQRPHQADKQSGWIDENRTPVSERVRTMLNKLDGQITLTYSIWRGDDPTSIIATRNRLDYTFIQAAGSADRMTVEARLSGKNGTPHLYTIGQKNTFSEKEILLPIGAERSVPVLENEVFDAEEATHVFKEFYLHNTVSNAFTLREIQ